LTGIPEAKRDKAVIFKYQTVSDVEIKLQALCLGGEGTMQVLMDYPSVILTYWPLIKTLLNII
jgi:hypothetical protein